MLSFVRVDVFVNLLHLGCPPPPLAGATLSVGIACRNAATPCAIVHRLIASCFVPYIAPPPTVRVSAAVSVFSLPLLMGHAIALVIVALSLCF